MSENNILIELLESAIVITSLIILLCNTFIKQYRLTFILSCIITFVCVTIIIMILEVSTGGIVL